MSRDAVVAGINLYDCAQLSALKAPAEDAEAIAQVLARSGGFRVRRLPEVKHSETNSIRVGRKTKVTLTQLEEALVQLFKPTGSHIPETALFYFRGMVYEKIAAFRKAFWRPVIPILSKITGDCASNGYANCCKIVRYVSRLSG
ncbi:MAG: hypothetical protein HC936_09330 [Leptolyngbyaceae cyanobacterium SU_3_3]|nr:hypothetical protein [Leptolyngbyaceae cyanobacterium SU_3_3]